jgi:hypothetical protein
MSGFTRLLSCAFAVLVLLPVALHLVGCGTGYFHPDFWAVTVAYRELVAANEHRVKLDADRKDLLVLPERRAEVLNDVIERRSTLLEAAGRFEELSRNTPRFPWEDFRWTFPGATDGERHCRHLIWAMSTYLADRPDRGTAVIRRLKAELEECLRRGPIQLPAGDGPRPLEAKPLPRRATAFLLEEAMPPVLRAT